MKITAHTKAHIHRTLTALVFASSTAIAQTTTPAPIAPPVAAAPIAPPATPVATGAESPAPIDAPITDPTGQPALPTVPTTPTGAGVSFDVNAPAGRVSEFLGDEMALVLRTLARQANMNVIVSAQVQGKVELRLTDKTPREVLEIIVDSNGLIMEERKGVTYIKTQAEKAKEPTVSGQYTFSYASADQVLPLLLTQLTSGVAPQFDKRTNTVFYRENESNLEKVRKFLEGIDSPTQQVMIEARLVEVNANPKQAYGFNWAGVVGSSTNAQTFRYGGSNLPDDEGRTTVDQVENGDFRLKSLLRDGTKLRTMANGLAGQFAILSVPQMSLTMRMLNEDSDAEFLANPRIVAANNQEATIKITRAQPVPNLTFNEQQAKAVFGGFQDKEFGNTLKVTPVINKDKFVSMKVQPEISNKVGDATFVFEGATVSSPVIDKRTFDSNVLIKSGDTLAIGGLLQDEGSKSSAKVPVAGDIPLFGHLFREKTAFRTKRNLMVFVTPTIIKHGYGTGLESQVNGLTHSGEEFADPTGWRNNAKGAIRLKPASNRPLAAEYAVPGLPPTPKKKK